MYIWDIYRDGMCVHQLQATEEYIQEYCSRTGTTYVLHVPAETAPEEPELEPEPSVDEILDVLLGVKTNEQVADG